MPYNLQYLADENSNQCVQLESKASIGYSRRQVLAQVVNAHATIWVLHGSLIPRGNTYDTEVLGKVSRKFPTTRPGATYVRVLTPVVVGGLAREPQLVNMRHSVAVNTWADRKPTTPVRIRMFRQAFAGLIRHSLFASARLPLFGTLFLLVREPRPVLFSLFDLFCSFDLFGLP